MAPSSPWVRLLKALGFSLGVLMFAAGLPMFLFTLATRRSREQASDVHLIVLAFFAGLAALGAWLILRSNRALVARVAGGLRALVRLPPRPAGAALLSLPGLALAWFAVGTLVMAVRADAALPGAMVAVFGYAVTAPVAIAFRPAWWMGALVSTILGLALLVAALATAEWLHPGAIGQGAMVFIAPIMGYPALLVLSGLVRWGTSRRRP